MKLLGRDKGLKATLDLTIDVEVEEHQKHEETIT